MLSVAEAARRARRDPETIRRWIRAGKLSAWKVGGQHVIDEADLSDAARGVLSATSGRTEIEARPSSAEIVARIHIREATTPDLERLTPSSTAGHDVSDLMLPQIVGRIVRAVDPSRIILFGSRGRGDQRPDSDYDLLVVLDQVEHRRAARIEIRRSFADVPVAADVLVTTLDEVDGRIHGRPTGAVYWALQDGHIIYDRDSRP